MLNTKWKVYFIRIPEGSAFPMRIRNKKKSEEMRKEKDEEVHAT